MKTLQLKNTKLELYYSCKEIPATRWNEVQKLVMEDIGIGSTMDSVFQHMNTLYQLVGVQGKEADSRQEIINLHNNWFFMIEKIDTRSYCLAPFIHTIDGKEFTDFSSDNVKATLEDLGKKGLTYEMISELVDELKKKLKANFNLGFLTGTPEPLPEIFTLS